MGKIILTERQYRNLNQILIGKEIGKNKGRLNEVAKTFTDFDGHRVQLMAAEVLEVIYNSANPALIYGVRVSF